jgi:multisubunit Na+/H+ antiporter MnhG subunit
MKAFALDILRRLRQPSTMAGLGVLMLAFGVAPITIDAITQVFVAVAALLAIVLDERASAHELAIEVGVAEGAPSLLERLGGLFKRS